MSFSSLGLSEPLVRAVTEQGYHTPTPIQLKAIPAVLAGGDLLAGAQTGTGKTAGFVLPILQQLSRPNAAPPGASASRRRPLRALILTPTRELAAQVEASVRVYGKHLNLTSTIVIGGVGMSPQTAALSRGVDILVATPGRLLDHHGERNVDFSHVEIFVLDEADRMLDMGFIHDIKRVLALLPKQRQNLLFSATFSDDIRALAAKLLHSPAMIDVAPRNATVDMIEQVVHPVDRDRKRELLSSLISRNDWHQVLVFTRTKHGANKLAEQLNDDGIRALAIHGNKSQSARTRALAEFKSGDLPVLVATDIAARGIDIDQLPHVVNYDLPNVPEDYVHRIGRTGRAGAAGEAVSLVCVDEHVFLRDIEKLIKKAIRRETIAGFEPDLGAKPQPIVQRRGQHARNGGSAAAGLTSRRGGVQQNPRSPSGRGGAQPALHTTSRGDAQPAPSGNGRRRPQAAQRGTGAIKRNR
jgi:ATP-dependent RNA helicase RhlE